MTPFIMLASCIWVASAAMGAAPASEAPTASSHERSLAASREPAADAVSEPEPDALRGPPIDVSPESATRRSGARARAADGTTAGARSGRRSSLAAHLREPRAASARFLDHGVLALGFGAGWPHRTRLELGVGLLDHLSVGATATFAPGDAAPRVQPRVALAAWRGPRVELGASYRPVLFPRPELGVLEAEARPFDPRADYLSATVVLNQGLLSGGADLGAVYLREPAVDPAAPASEFRGRWAPGGGLFLRVGTRRVGLSVAGQMPAWTLDLALDLRFGLFELRPPGGWRLTDTRDPALPPPEPASERAPQESAQPRNAAQRSPRRGSPPGSSR